MSKIMLSVKNLQVKLQSNLVLDKVSFSVKEGGVTAVIGPNGSGKTTLFKAILGLVNFAGEIKIWNKDVTGQLGVIGYVPQSFEFDRTIPITVKEFLSFFESKESDRADSVLKRLEIQGLADKILGKMSGGQLQRVLIGASLMKKPRLLLMDEPVSGVDLEGTKDFYSLVKELNEQGVTIIIISHEINMVYSFADQVICLNRDLVCNGVPKEVITKDVLDKLYGDNIDLRSHKH